MLKISFLVTFCGLLARMAQAQSLPCNQMPCLLSADILGYAVARGVPPNIIAPNPTPVNDQTTGAEYTNLKPTGTTDVSCKVNTQGNDGPITVAVSGQAQYIGQFKTSGSVKDVNSDVTNSVTASYSVSLNSNGVITCKPPSSTDEAQVTCIAKPAPGGLLSGLVGAVLNILNGLLTALSGAIKGLVELSVPELLKLVTDLLNGFLKKLTDEKPIGNNQTCKQKVTTVKTNSNNCLTMVMESSRYAEDGAAIPPPNGTYTPPQLQPATDTGCMWAVPQGWINKALESITKTPFVVTGAALASLSRQIQGLCGNNGISLEKMEFMPTGTPQVAITTGKVSATLTGNLQVSATGNSSPLLTATGTLTFKATFEYENACLMINLEFIAIATANLHIGPSCNVTNLVCQTFTEQLQGKVTIKTCVMSSPGAGLGLQGLTTITPVEGCVVVDNKK